MRRLPHIGTVLLALAAGCSQSQNAADSGSNSMNNSSMDSGQSTTEDAGPALICANLQQQGNEDGVGHVCHNSSECPSSAPICALQWRSLLGSPPAIPKANVCLIPDCNPCWDIQSQCGSNAACVCFNENECACAPTSCTLFAGPADAGIMCPADAGPPMMDGGADGGIADAGDAGPADAGDAGLADAGLADAGDAGVKDAH